MDSSIELVEPVERARGGVCRIENAPGVIERVVAGGENLSVDEHRRGPVERDQEARGTAREPQERIDEVPAEQRAQRSTFSR